MSKGVLQEIFQKKNMKLPIYSYIKEGDMFICTVELCDGSMYTGDICSTKKESAKNVASLALDSMDECTFIEDDILAVQNMFGQLSSSVIHTLIIVDVENVPRQVKYLVSLNDKLNILGVYSNNYNGLVCVKNKLVDSTIVNAADIYICCYVMKMIHKRKYDNIIILSRDKFALTLVDVIKHFTCDTNVYSCETLDELYSIMED